MSIEGVSLRFDDGATHALKSVDLEIRENEFVAIVGPSGCGKSSLLNVIGTLERPTAGEVYFRTTPYSDLPDHALFRRAHVGFVFQSFHLIPTFSALDNVLLPTIGTGGSAACHEDRARSLLAKLGLEGRLHHFPANLSGGERQRVAIARALINDPDLILADEPTGSLDSASAAEVLDLIAGIRDQREISVVMVTHDAAVSKRADRIVRMRDGRIESDLRR